ncbi:MAG: hypothetical protein V1914_03220, partial [archaeon]
MESEKGQEIIAASKELESLRELYAQKTAEITKIIEQHNQAKAKLESLEITVENSLEPIEDLTSVNPSKRLTKEQLLTVSARDYCESVGHSLRDYTLIGLYATRVDYLLDEPPKNTEVIVDLKALDRGCSGTALIPKLESIGLKMFNDDTWQTIVKDLLK